MVMVIWNGSSTDTCGALTSVTSMLNNGADLSKIGPAEANKTFVIHFQGFKLMFE